MAFPTRNIPDLRAARKIASHLSTKRPGQLVDVRRDGEDYRVVYTHSPSEYSLGTYKDGRLYAFENPLSPETKQIIVGVAGGIIVAGLITWLVSKV
jgi:hypothetical protein